MIDDLRLAALPSIRWTLWQPTPLRSYWLSLINPESSSAILGGLVYCKVVREARVKRSVAKLLEVVKCSRGRWRFGSHPTQRLRTSEMPSDVWSDCEIGKVQSFPFHSGKILWLHVYYIIRNCSPRYLTLASRRNVSILRPRLLQLSPYNTESSNMRQHVYPTCSIVCTNWEIPNANKGFYK